MGLLTGCRKEVFQIKDQVNNPNSAFIFMINILIIQGCQSGSVGQVVQVVPYLIFVTGATGGARVNFFWPV